jgi:hypothetical protein
MPTPEEDKDKHAILLFMDCSEIDKDTAMQICSIANDAVEKNPNPIYLRTLKDRFKVNADRLTPGKNTKFILYATGKALSAVNALSLSVATWFTVDKALDTNRSASDTTHLAYIGISSTLAVVSYFGFTLVNDFMTDKLERKIDRQLIFFDLLIKYMIYEDDHGVERTRKIAIPVSEDICAVPTANGSTSISTVLTLSF